MTALAKFDIARRALAEAKTLPDMQKVRGLAAAIEALARVAGDRTLIADAIELQVNADRRLGEMLIEAKDKGEFSQGNRAGKGTNSEPLTLADIGVDKKLSSKAQRTAKLGKRVFDDLIKRHRNSVLLGRNVSFEATIRETDLQKARAAHEAKVYDGGSVEHLQALIDAGRNFGAIYADPAWAFLSRGSNGDGRSASAHYTTTRLDEMKALPVAQLAAPDCVLFMWAVDWCLQDALDLIRAWGFELKTTAFTWVKSTSTGDAEFMGQGYWTRANPEMCLLATRGHPKRLNADVRQLMTAPVMEHSRKPDETYNRIERLVAGPYLELFARRPRDHWVSWGNELPFIMPGHELPYDPTTGEIHDERFTIPAAAPPGEEAPQATGYLLVEGQVSAADLADPETLKQRGTFVPVEEGDDEEEPETPPTEPKEPAEIQAGSYDDLEIPAFLRRAS